MREVMQRFVTYMDYKGLNDNQVTNSCNLGVGLLNQARAGKSDLGKKTINKILNVYQDLNRVWLLTGDGNMLNSINDDDIIETDRQDEVDSLSHRMKIAPLVPVDITKEQNVRIWDYVNRNKRDLDTIPSQMMPKFDLIHTVRSNALQPEIEKGDVLFLQHLELSTDSIVNGHIYFIDTKKNGIVIKKVFINEGNLECYSLTGKEAIKTFSLDDIYDIFSISAIMKFSVHDIESSAIENMFEKVVNNTNTVLNQNTKLIEIVDKLTSK